MGKNPRTMIAAGLIAVIGVLLLFMGYLIPGVVVIVLAAGGLVYLLRSGEGEGEFLKSPRKKKDKRTAGDTETDTVEADEDYISFDDGAQESLSTWEPEGEGLATWEPEGEGLATWETEIGGGESLSTWEPEATTSEESLGTWEPEATGGESLGTWEPETGEEIAEGTESFETWETSSAFEEETATSFEEMELAEEEPAPSGGGLFSVPGPIDENVHSDDDIMAASQATELAIDTGGDSGGGGGDNSELAKLLAKVQTRLAAYE